MREALNSINKQILDGHLDEAETALKGLTPISQVENRMVMHFHGIIELRRGHIDKARDILQSARDRFGDNVNLIRELATCHYQSGDMIRFRRLVDELERVVVELDGVLNTQTLVECETMLGKFLEEDARLAPALIYYDKALIHAINPLHRIRVLLQKGRWHALYESTQSLSGLYRELISVPAEAISQDLMIELEHSLMLMELRLIGADHAWQRYLRLDGLIDDFDQRLLVFDFVEGCLNQDLKLNADVLDVLNQFKNPDPYEDFIRRLIQENQTSTMKIQRLNELASRLPWASYLRLLCLTANLESEMGAKHELNRKIQLIISSLDIKSQSLWMTRIKRALQTPEVRVEYSAQTRSIVVHGKAIDLSKKKIGQQLLDILVKKPTLTVDQAIDHLWQSTFTPEHYHRLRMGIHRLNTLIHDISGQGKIIEVDSQEVRLRPEVRLRATDGFDDPPSILN